MRIALLFKAWRHREELSEEEAGKRIGLTRDSYRRVEQGQPMAPATFMRIMQWIMGEGES